MPFSGCFICVCKLDFCLLSRALSLKHDPNVPFVYGNHRFTTFAMLYSLYGGSEAVALDRM